MPLRSLDAFVIVRDESGKTPRIIRASFFSKNRIDISEKIKSSHKWSDPTGQSSFVIIIYYGTQGSCKAKLKEISPGPAIWSDTRKHFSDNSMATTSRQQRNSDCHALDETETTTCFNVMKRYLESIINRLETIVKHFNDRFDHLDDTLSNCSMGSNSFRDPSSNITDYAMNEMANRRNDPKVNL